MMSLFLGMMLSTFNIIPPTSLAYDTVWKVAMPLAVALLLLETDMRRAFTEAGMRLHTSSAVNVVTFGQIDRN